MASGPLTEEQVFGVQPAYGTASGEPLTPDQQAYAYRMATARDPSAPGGSIMNPSYVTPAHPATGSGYEVAPTGHVNIPSGGAGGMTDADVFGSALPPAAPVDRRPTSQGLGFGEGVNTVARNLLDLPNLSRQLGFMSPGDPRSIAALVATLPGRFGTNTAQHSFDQMEKTYRPGLAGKWLGEGVASIPLAAEGGPLVTGALQGYLTSESKDPFGKAASMAEGAVGGKIGDKVFGALSSVAAPTLRPAAQWAAENGIRLTPGAITGGPLEGVENNVISKLAFAGPLVRNAQTRSIEDFNKATINNALKGAGLRLPQDVPAGTKAIDAAHTALSDGYNAIVPKLTAAPDPAFAAAIDGLKAGAGDLSDQYAAKAAKLIDRVQARFDPHTGQMSGPDLKAMDAHLGEQARRFGKAQDPLANEYGDFASELQGHLRDLTERANPDFAPQLRGLNNGWAQLVRIEKAGANAATNGGVFTPDGLINAAKATDSSARSNATARGTALLQDWANQAKEVVPAKMPAPGSPLSNIMEGLVTLGVGKESGMHGVGAAAAIEAALSGLYSRPGQAALRAAMTERPQALRDLVARLQDLRGVSSDAGAIALPKALPPPQAAVAGLLPYLPGQPAQPN